MYDGAFYCNRGKAAPLLNERGNVYISAGNINYFIMDDISLDEFNSWVSQNNIIIVAPLAVAGTEPINESDLEFLRSLENMQASDNVIITDNHGRDVSFIVEYIRKLSEVS